jgi:hypothetical protein
MAFLTLDFGGANEVDVSCESAKETTPVEIGVGSVRAFAGNLRNCTRSLKRTWSATTIALDTTAATAVLTAIGAFKSIVCTGDLFLGTSVTCRVKYNNSTPVSVAETIAGYNFLWQLELTFEEV